MLLDGVLAAAKAERPSGMLDGSREAEADLALLERTLAAAVEAKAAQSCPHFVLLDAKYYKREIAPAAARWLLVWIKYTFLPSVETEASLAAILGDESVEAVLSSAPDARSDDAVKLFALARQWITSLLPFTLAKINRVSYGLLSAADIALITSDGARQIPRARRLLAVPFVGLDIPSRTNEFAQPDVLIGVTIAAYKYEGLRLLDTRALVAHLREELDAQEGPPRRREAPGGAGAPPGGGGVQGAPPVCM